LLLAPTSIKGASIAVRATGGVALSDMGNRRLTWANIGWAWPTIKQTQSRSILLPLLEIPLAWVKLSSGTLKEFVPVNFFLLRAGAGKGGIGKKYFAVQIQV
jgi:hypothetical protein